jgi:hypothetical protein
VEKSGHKNMRYFCAFQKIAQSKQISDHLTGSGPYVGCELKHRQRQVLKKVEMESSKNCFQIVAIIS